LSSHHWGSWVVNIFHWLVNLFKEKSPAFLPVFFFHGLMILDRYFLFFMELQQARLSLLFFSLPNKFFLLIVVCIFLSMDRELLGFNWRNSLAGVYNGRFGMLLILFIFYGLVRLLSSDH
jgi:hypothetical protein